MALTPAPFQKKGNPPVLLLPDNVRIRRFNLSSEQYFDYVDNAEHIQALDYEWDPEGEGLSETNTVQPSVLFGCIESANNKRLYSMLEPG